MSPTTKAQENFLRRCINQWSDERREVWELRKSRVRNPDAHSYGKYAVYDCENERWLTNGFSLDFDEAEEFFIRAVAEEVTDGFELTLGELEDQIAPKDVFGWLLDNKPLDRNYATAVMAVIEEESPGGDEPDHAEDHEDHGGGHDITGDEL